MDKNKSYSEDLTETMMRLREVCSPVMSIEEANQKGWISIAQARETFGVCKQKAVDLLKDMVEKGIMEESKAKHRSGQKVSVFKFIK